MGRGLCNFYNHTAGSIKKVGVVIQKKKADFYVGENSCILPAKYAKWIGKNKRESLLKKTKNPVINNLINMVYRQGSFIGDGSTATALLFEKRTGMKLSKHGGHEQKVDELIRHLSKKILPNKELTNNERKLLNQFIGN